MLVPLHDAAVGPHLVGQNLIAVGLYELPVRLIPFDRVRQTRLQIKSDALRFFQRPPELGLRLLDAALVAVPDRHRHTDFDVGRGRERRGGVILLNDDLEVHVRHRRDLGDAHLRAGASDAVGGVTKVGVYFEDAVEKHLVIEHRGGHRRAAGQPRRRQIRAANRGSELSPGRSVPVVSLPQGRPGLLCQSSQLGRLVRRRLSAAQLVHLDAKALVRQQRNQIGDPQLLLRDQHREIRGPHLRDQVVLRPPQVHFRGQHVDESGGLGEAKLAGGLDQLLVLGALLAGGAARADGVRLEPEGRVRRQSGL